MVILSILSCSCQFDSSVNPLPGAVSADASLDALSPVVIDGALHDALEADAAVPDCWTNMDYAEDSVDGHRYRVFFYEADWMAGFDRCIDDQSHLVVIDSIEENDYLEALVDRRIWIGFHDRTNEGVFEWVNSAVPGFYNWNTSEPNDSGAGEDCVEMYPWNGKWNDLACSDRHSFVCECDPTFVP